MTKNKRHKIALKGSASLSGPDLAAFVRQFIAGALADGDPAITKAAEAAKLNVRTLQRRLLDAGFTYHQLVCEIRLETAIVLLVRTDKTVAAISRALGYSHPGHFTRAFKRWTGAAPSTIRQRLRRGCGGR
ncbi:MAG: AraC family transcriptional regulator [Kiloniellales bacterium]|nr:AraC family transcriptional regulator [Kiloniellales bacterium]